MIRRKKYIVTVALISMLAFSNAIFTGCEKKKIDCKLNIPDKYNKVGKLHNQGLDFVFNKIKRKSIALVKENDSNSLKNARSLDYQALVTEGTREFCKTNKELKDKFSEYKNALNLSDKKLKSTASASMKKDELNDIQIDLIKRISEAIKECHKNNDLSYFKSELNYINKTASLKLEEKEAAVIYSATSTALNSYQYWLKNYKKWYFSLNYPEIIEKYKDEELNSLQFKNGTITLKSGSNWYESTWNTVEGWWDTSTDYAEEWWNESGRDIALTDAGGAVTGALDGLAAGPLTGGGSIAAGAVGVGLSASAGYCVYDLGQ